MSSNTFIIVTYEDKDNYDNFAIDEVYYEGDLIGSIRYGGEPEDNSKYRDYAGVIPLITKIIKICNFEFEQDNRSLEDLGW